MNNVLTREKPIKPVRPTPPRGEPRRAIVTRAELAPCTCPEHCERDHEHD